MDSTPQKPGFTFNAFGNITQQGRFLEAFEGFEEEWEPQGYEALTSTQAEERLSGFPPYPLAWKIEGPTNSAFGEHFFQFIAFLKEPATTAAIEVLLGTILHAALMRYRQVFSGRSKKYGALQFPVQFCPTLWFEREEVLVTIMIALQSAEEFTFAELLIPEGFKRASLYLSKHGKTHRYLTYYIRNHKLDPTPTLSNLPPKS